MDVACWLVEGTLRMYPQVSTCSFDKGFQSPGNRQQLDELLEVTGLRRVACRQRQA